MKPSYLTSAVILILFLSLRTAFSQEALINKVTDKVIVLNIENVANGNVVAISSQKGIIVIDTEWSPISMQILRDAIEKEFPNDKISLVINTHAHVHHCGGNAIFKDLPIIAHENIIEDMQWWLGLMKSTEKKERSGKRFQDKISKRKDKLQNQELSKEQIATLKIQIQLYEDMYEEIIAGYEIVYPNILFSDEMSINMGDLTLNLRYMGNGHSKSNISIHIPEEKVVVGAEVVKIVPYLSSKKLTTDIKRKIHALEKLLENSNTIEYVVEGHGYKNVRDINDLKRQHAYYRELLKKIEKAKNDNLTLENIKDELSLNNTSSHFVHYKNASEKEKDRHVKNIEEIWEYVINSTE